MLKFCVGGITHLFNQIIPTGLTLGTIAPHIATVACSVERVGSLERCIWLHFSFLTPVLLSVAEFTVMSVGIPVKLLHEGEGHNVTIELRNGEVYRGLLNESEDNMNCQLSNVTFTARDGSTRQLEAVYLRGSQIRFVVLPELLKNAPMFKRVQQMKESREAKQASKG